MRHEGEDDERAVLWDAVCDEPIAWRKPDAPIIGEQSSYGGEKVVQYSRILTAEEAVKRYGPVTKVTVGLYGDVQQVTLAGRTTFASKAAPLAELRALATERTQVIVDDWITDRVACPRCKALAGEHCIKVSTRHRARDRFAAQWDALPWATRSKAEVQAWYMRLER